MMGKLTPKEWAAYLRANSADFGVVSLPAKGAMAVAELLDPRPERRLIPASFFWLGAQGNEASLTF